MSTVSVILPCYNHASFLSEAARGILGQTHTDLQLIMVDDCSRDDSWEIMHALEASDSRVKAIRHPRNRGLSASRNDALREATGEFIAFCDADDVWEPDKLEFQLGLLRAHPDADLVYCDTTIIDEAGRPVGKRFSDVFPPPDLPSGDLFESLLERNFINIQSVLMRRSCLSTVDHFDESFRVLEDWWFWLQLSCRHRFLYSGKFVARYRVHGNTLNASRPRSFQITRIRVFRRLVETMPDLSPQQRAHALFAMGADLRDVGRRRWGRRVLCRALQHAVASGEVLLALRSARRLSGAGPAGRLLRAVRDAARQ